MTILSFPRAALHVKLSVTLSVTELISICKTI